MLSEVVNVLAEANRLVLSDSVLFGEVNAITAKVTVVYPVNVTKVHVDVIY